MVAFVGVTACVSEDFGSTDPVPSSENVGYLSLGGNGIEVFFDQEVGEGDVSPQTATNQKSGTRAETEEQLANYTVQIIKGAEVIQSFRYGDWNNSQVVTNYKENHQIDATHTVTGIELPVGTYTIRVFSAETPNESDTPQYEGKTEVTLKKGTATQASVVCKLSSVKVTVTFDSILADVIDPAHTSVMARLDEAGAETPSAYTWSGYTDKSSLVKSHAEVVPTYLKPQAPTYDNTGALEGSPLNIYLTTIYGGTQAAGTGSQINAQRLPVVDNAKAGEWRKVTIKLENGTNGTVFFVVNVETWVYNQQINVSQTKYAANIPLKEAEIPDVTDAPVIETPVGGLSFEESLTLTEDMFVNGAYQGDASMTVKTKQPIKALYLSATSDSEGLPELLTYLGLDATASAAAKSGYAGLNLVGSMNAATKSILSTWGFPTSSIEGQTEVSFNIAGLLKQLQEDESFIGNHSFSLTIVDEKENNATYTLQITSGIIETDIVWVGEDISKRYDIYTGGGDPTQMKIKVTAASGIKSLRVAITGPLADVVSDVGLSASFDLVNPVNDEGEDMSASLAGLKFPVGDNVRDKKVISFDITGFKELMGMADVSGENNFKITLIENDTAAPVVEETMMINVINEAYPGN